MRSSRNCLQRLDLFRQSLIDWKMRSSRNIQIPVTAATSSLIDWKMRSSQKIAWLYGIYPRAMNYSFFIHKISKCF